MEISNNYERLPRNYSLLNDEYEYTMANGYLLNKMKDTEAVFDVFFRKIPNDGGYAIMAGVDKVIEYIKNLRFTDKELSYFIQNGYNNEFIDYLRNFKFTGDLYAIPDGTPVFPNEPILTVKAKIIEAQILETTILSLLNGSMEHATAARRIVESTPKGVGVMEFGSRRADGLEASIDSALYGIMAGCVGTSNTIAADMLGIKAMGTQAHSWIESFPTELDAFISYAKEYPNNCILLVDTYDTLRSGIPNAIKTFEYMKNNNLSTENIGIRIDSGDLAYLSKEARRMFNEAGFPNAKICLSNGLTAETIESLTREGACFDMLGVGDNISKPCGRMGCVYKLVALKENNSFSPKIKLSNDTIKITNPGFKDIYRAYDKETGYALADIMTLKDAKLNKDELLIISPQDYFKQKIIDNYELVKLQKEIFINGELVYNDSNIFDKQKYCENEMNKIYPEIKRTMNPHIYYVDGTKEYVDMKNKLISETRKKVINETE